MFLEIKTGHELSGVVINPNGEKVVNLISGAFADSNSADYGRYGTIAPALQIGDELFITASRAGSYPWYNFSPIVLSTLALPGAGFKLYSPKFSYGDMWDEALILPVPNLHPEGDPNYDPADYERPYPSAALLRWTGACWLVVAATKGVTVGPRPAHA